jgi:hypothetical protein
VVARRGTSLAAIRGKLLRGAHELIERPTAVSQAPACQRSSKSRPVTIEALDRSSPASAKQMLRLAYHAAPTGPPPPITSPHGNHEASGFSLTVSRV